MKFPFKIQHKIAIWKCLDEIDQAKLTTYLDSFKEGQDMVGNRTKVKIVKNKMAPPFKVAEFDIMHDEGVSYSGSLLDVAVELGIIEQKGSFFNMAPFYKCGPSGTIAPPETDTN